MLTATEVSKALTDRKCEQFLPCVALIVQIANVYLTYGADPDELRLMYVGDAAAEALDAMDPKSDAFELAYAVAFFAVAKRQSLPNAVAAEQYIRTSVPVPGLAQQAPGVPTPPPRPADRTAAQFVEYRKQLAAMRAVKGVDARGELLAAFALSLEGQIRWVRSGAVAPDQPGHVTGPKFDVRAEWDHTRREHATKPWKKHETLRNDFAAWMHGGHKPKRGAAMNCWEAVMFSAFRAGLVTPEDLRRMHRRAALAYEISHGSKDADIQPTASRHYNLALSHAFQFYSSVPFAPKAGLIPRCGEILFWDRDQHVAISLGRTYESNEPRDWIMSNWNKPQEGFRRIWITLLGATMWTNFRFRPCPF